MEALRYIPKTNSISLELNIEIPKIKNEDDVLVQVHFAGLCGTDVHIWQGEFPASKVPVTLGHEFSGVVIDSGSKVSDLPKGTKVGINPNNWCNACQSCYNGHPNYCQNGGLRSTIGIFLNGGFAKFCIVPLNLVNKLPNEVSMEQGALCEPLSCILHGWDRLQMVNAPQPDSKIVIMGAGIIGNLWMCLLHHYGFRDVIVSEPSPIRRKLAAQLETGFHILSPDELEQSMPKSRVEAEQFGIDVVIDCTGVPKALENIIPYLARGAKVLIFGCAPTGQSMKICPEEIFSKELTILGTQIQPFTYARSIALAKVLGSRYLDMKKLGIEVTEMKNYKPALEKLKLGEISKVMFKLI